MILEEHLETTVKAHDQQLHRRVDLLLRTGKLLVESKKLGGEKTVKAVKKSLRSDYTQHFRAKNKNLLNTICEYASLNPFEAVACDLSKRFIENVNKNKLTIEQNFISKSPYRKHHFFLLPFTKTETNPLSDLLRKCWNGKFER